MAPCSSSTAVKLVISIRRLRASHQTCRSASFLLSKVPKLALSHRTFPDGDCKFPSGSFPFTSKYLPLMAPIPTIHTPSIV